jgi:uncharacterized RDD family membrane protein YckC
MLREGVLKAGAIAGVLVVIAVTLLLYVIPQDMRDNVILGMVILGILGTFGVIAYYYTTIELGSKK